MKYNKYRVQHMSRGKCCVELHNKKTKIILDMDNLRSEKTRQEKRREKLNLSKENLVESINEKAEVLVIKLG